MKELERYLLSGNRSNFIEYEGNILWYYQKSTKKISPLYIFEDERCYKRIPKLYKNKVLFVDTLSRHIFGTQQYHLDQKTATTLYI